MNKSRNHYCYIVKTAIVETAVEQYIDVIAARGQEYCTYRQTECWILGDTEVQLQQY